MPEASPTIELARRFMTALEAGDVEAARACLAPDARIYEFLSREAVHELVGEHLRGEKNRRLLIWSLLNVEEWCRQFLSN